MTEMTLSSYASCSPIPPSAARSTAKRLPHCSASIRTRRTSIASGGGPRYFSPPGTRRVWYAELDVLRWLAPAPARARANRLRPDPTHEKRQGADPAAGVST